VHGGFGGAVLYSLLIRDFKHNSNRIAISRCWWSRKNSFCYSKKNQNWQ